MNLVCPPTADTAKWNNYVTLLTTKIVPILEQHGVTVIGNTTEFPTELNVILHGMNNTTPLEGSLPIGELYKLSIPEIKAMCSILTPFGNLVRDNIKGRQTFKDIFYSDISYSLNLKWKNYACRIVLFCWMCSILQKNNIHVHS